MANFSLIEKLKIVLNTILSTPLFSVSTFIGILLIGFMIYCIITKKKLPKWLYIVGWLFVIIFIIFRYTKLVPTLLDNLVDTVFKCLYFPSLGLYVSIVILANIIFILLNIQKNIRKSYRIISLITAVILNVLFIFVAGVMTKNKIDISTPINLYTNSTLLVLLQISMAIFIIFILLVLFIRIYIKIKLLDSVQFGEDFEYPAMEQCVSKTVLKPNNNVFVRKVIKKINKPKQDIKVHKIMKRG